MMTLSQLLDIHLPEKLGLLKVSGLQDDSRQVCAGDLFFAMPGTHANGVAFAKRALERGAVAVVSQENPVEGLENQWVQVPNVATSRLHAVNVFYGYPMAKLQCHGVTGTNGKTTTAFIMHAVLTAAGRPTALLGTICQRIGSTDIPASLTTPGLLELYAFAAKAVAAGCTDLVMEVSSHSLHQERVAGQSFRSALFSNLTQDHLDYHQTMGAYFEAKRLLFSQYLATQGVAVVNIDDPYGFQLYQQIAESVETVAVTRQGHEYTPNPVEHIEYTENGIRLTLPVLGEKPFETQLCGEFNADNVLLVAGWVMALCLPVSAFRKALETVRVPGRFEMVYNDGKRRVVVDYAHTPDALERVLQTARALCKGTLHVVFGCGGDRDKGKRPLMGQIAVRGAQVVWVTSDNPRTEDPQQIIADIVNGLESKNLNIVLDRAQAIHQASQKLKEGDWLVVAGKGHENYQIIGTEKTAFDDRLVVMEAMSAC